MEQITIQVKFLPRRTMGFRKRLRGDGNIVKVRKYANF